MKNLFKIFVVVAGMAAVLYSCEPKKTEEKTPVDTVSSETAPAPDSLATGQDSNAAAKEDSANAGK